MNTSVKTHTRNGKVVKAHNRKANKQLNPTTIGVAAALGLGGGLLLRRRLKGINNTAKAAKAASNSKIPTPKPSVEVRSQAIDDILKKAKEDKAILENRHKNIDIGKNIAQKREAANRGLDQQMDEGWDYLTKRRSAIEKQHLNKLSDRKDPLAVQTAMSAALKESNQYPDIIASKERLEKLARNKTAKTKRTNLLSSHLEKTIKPKPDTVLGPAAFRSLMQQHAKDLQGAGLRKGTADYQRKLRVYGQDLLKRHNRFLSSRADRKRVIGFQAAYFLADFSR